MIIPNQEVLIVALDFKHVRQARDMVNQLGDTVKFYKIGLQLFSAQDSHNFIDWLVFKNKKVFLDLKMYDIPETVYQATLLHSRMGITYSTIHGCSTDSVEAATKAACAMDSSLGILAVTVLTSNNDHHEQRLVEYHARNAKSVGAVGAIASGLEAADVKYACGYDFIVVCPGVRDIGAAADDQKRVATVETALENGANHLVIGRPITRAESPASHADSIQKRINDVLDKGYDIAD